MEGLIFKGAYTNRNRKSASKQAIALLIQISGRKNVLRKLLRIPYRRLKAGIFCVLTVLVCCWSSE